MTVRFVMDQVTKFVEPGRQFAKDSIRLVKRCTKPDRKGNDQAVVFWYCLVNSPKWGLCARNYRKGTWHVSIQSQPRCWFLVITFLIFISHALCCIANLNAGHLDHTFLIKQILTFLCIYIKKGHRNVWKDEEHVYIRPCCHKFKCYSILGRIPEWLLICLMICKYSVTSKGR